MTSEKQEKPKQKRQYIIQVEATAPIKAEFSVWATDPEEAGEMWIKNQSVAIRSRPDVDLSRMRQHKVAIKDPMTSLVTPVKLV